MSKETIVAMLGMCVLLGCSLDPNIRLIKAARQGDAAGVRGALKAGAIIGHRDKELEATALCYAAFGDHRDATLELLAAGANPNEQDACGQFALIPPATVRGTTVLMFAARSGGVGAVQALVDARADVNARNILGWTSLMLAIWRGNIEGIKVLLQAHANVDAETLKWAKEKAPEGKRTAIRTLLKGANEAPAVAAPEVGGVGPTKDLDPKSERAPKTEDEAQTLIRKLVDKHESAVIRAKAAWALGDLKRERATAPLILALADEEWMVRANAAGALGKLKDASAIAPLIGRLKDANPKVRANSAAAFAAIGDARAVEPLILALKDTAAEVRLEVVGALMALKDVRAVPSLITTLRDNNSDVRVGASAALGVIKDVRALEPLTVALKDADQRVRANAAGGLGEIRDLRAVKPLALVLQGDTSDDVKREASWALKNITGQSFGKDSTAWLKWWDARRGD